MGKVFGIDMGSSHTRIYVKGVGLKVREPSVVAVDNRANRIRAAGNAAKMMMGKTPAGITACAPLQNGVIADFDIASAMLEYFFRREAGKSLILSRPRVLLAVPHCATATERRSFYEAAARAGAKSVGLVPETLAAAIGVGLKIEEPKGKMIVNIGGGTTEVAVISFGGAVLTNSIRIGGVHLDRAISAYMRRRHSIVIGDVTAELLKKNIGSVFPTEENSSMEVHGSSGGHPVSVTVTSDELRDALRTQAGQIVECIRSAFERTTPELCSDIRETGILLTGGSSLVHGIDRLIEQKTGIRTVCAKQPVDSIAVGLGKILEQGDRFGIVERTER